MTLVSGRALGAALLVVFGSCSAAQASTVVLEFSGAAIAGYSVTTPGVGIGDAITFKVYADNGGTNLISQNWNYTDVLYATMEAGTYSATTSGAVLAGFGSFSTDASGQLSSLDFAVSQAGTDTNGNLASRYYMNAVNNIWFTYTDSSFSVQPDDFGAVSPPDIYNTTISLVSTTVTPLPATLPLFATGLGALGLLRWRKKREIKRAA